MRGLTNVKVDLSNPHLEFVSSLHSPTNSCPPPRRGQVVQRFPECRSGLVRPARWRLWMDALKPLRDDGKAVVRRILAQTLKPVQGDVKSLAKDVKSPCPPLETLPNKNNPVDCFCERKPKSLISRRGRERSEHLTPHPSPLPKGRGYFLPLTILR